MDKKKSKGRPKFVPDKNQLCQLYKKVKNKELTNEQCWTLISCKHSLWYKMKREFEILEGNKNVKSN